MSEEEEEKKEMYRTESQINLRIHENEAKADLENNWRSCSGCLIDKRSLVFFTTLRISVAVIAFCIVKLSLSHSCEDSNTWMALLMFVLGVWVRAPSL